MDDDEHQHDSENDGESGRDDDEKRHDGEFAAQARQPPGPLLAAWLSELSLDEIETHDLVLAVQAIDRLVAHVEALQVQALAELCERPEYARCSCPVDVLHEHRAIEPAGDEVSLALAWAPGRAKNRVAAAVELVHDLPDTLTALTCGLIDADKARLIVERTRCLGDVSLRREVEARVLPIASRKTRAQLDRAVRREVIAADPDAAEQRRRTAADQRRVSRPEPADPGGNDGMASMNLCGPAEDLAALYTAIDAAARRVREQGDERNLDQLRFDTLTGLGWTGLDLAHLGCCNPACTGVAATTVAATDDTNGRDTTSPGATSPGATSTAAATSSNDARHGADGTKTAATSADRQSDDVVWLGRRHGRAAAVGVTVAASTLFGADEQPGWLDGFGPITADASRRISTEGPWRRLLTDPVTRELLDYGRTTYAPPARLAAFVAARDRTCRLPTCEHPATAADIDHKQPFNRGGATSAANTWALHDAHHFARTHHGYTIHTDARGITWWTTPAGLHYAVDPEIIGPVTTPSAAAATFVDEPAPF